LRRFRTELLATIKISVKKGKVCKLVKYLLRSRMSRGKNPPVTQKSLVYNDKVGE